MTQRKFGVVQPTPEELKKSPRSEQKTASDKERSAREDGLRKPKK